MTWMVTFVTRSHSFILSYITRMVRFATRNSGQFFNYTTPCITFLITNHGQFCNTTTWWVKFLTANHGRFLNYTTWASLTQLFVADDGRFGLTGPNSTFIHTYTFIQILYTNKFIYKNLKRGVWRLALYNNSPE